MYSIAKKLFYYPQNALLKGGRRGGKGTGKGRRKWRRKGRRRGCVREKVTHFSKYLQLQIFI
jgi:hypothetical protein